MNKYPDDAVALAVTMYWGTAGSKDASYWQKLKDAVEMAAPQQTVTLNNKGRTIELTGEKRAELMNDTPAITAAMDKI